MSEGDPIPWHDASRYANEFADRISDVCTVVKVAGSVRRRKAYCGDIEIVAQPVLARLQSTLDGSMAGTFQRNELHTRMVGLRRDGIVMTDRPRKDLKRNPFGERYYRVNYVASDGSIVPVDLFSVIPPSQFGTVFLIRTGSEAFSKWIVQLRYRDGYVFRDGHLEHTLMGVVATPNEDDVFRTLGIDWIPPEKRDLTRWGYRMWLTGEVPD